MSVLCDSAEARFGFYLYRTSSDEHPAEDCFRSSDEMNSHVHLLGTRGEFYRIETYRHVSGEEWELLAEFGPDDFEEERPWT